ncbi:L,D-transpeptidase family protein [Aquamicrobium ahrensii]|uniref:Murein L,D-transpeptidase YcbB/YkuD n=1 Tax=Aquamicrobium ahrensii TaxID=469551 RepID=A0ABV2KG38_9HYPH
MRQFKKAAWFASVTLLGSGIALSAQPASAQTLMDMLFGGPSKRHSAPMQGEFPPPPKPKAAAPIKKISAPTYNAYKPDKLTRVDFTALTETPQKAAFSPADADETFAGSVSALEGFELLAEPAIARALVEYYSANPDFIWISNGALDEKAREAIRVLSDASSHGFLPADYVVEAPNAGQTADRAELIRFEMTLSARVLRYARDARQGRIQPNRISGYYDFPEKPINLAGVLGILANTKEVRAYLESRHPQNPEYEALRVELEALESSAENDITVEPGLLLKPGQSSAELPKLLTLIQRDIDDEMRARHGEVLARLAASEVYEPDLTPVFEDVQKKAGLKPDGIIGARTVAAIAGETKADRLAKVRIAMEQLRWLPSDLGNPRVFINQPAFTASYIEGGEEKLKTRTVVGSVSNQTSFFYDEIKQVDYNPYWGVPQSIIVNEMLPRLRSDPGYLDRAGYEVTDSKGKRIPSSSIDWSQYGGRVPFNVRQAPSEANALGELKILFPNKHAIYMHDTPQKAYFQRDMRALSHGCVRLQDPRGMAAAVLGTSVEHIADKLGKGHSTEKVTRRIPVYVAYFTAWPDMAGKMEYFGDIYGRDDRLKQAIAATEAARSPSS